MADAAFTLDRAKDFVRQHRTRIFAATILLACALIVTTAAAGQQAFWLFALLPVAIAAALPLVGQPELTASINDWEAFFSARLEKAQASEGKISRYFLRPLFAGSLKLWTTTVLIPDPHVKAGVRLGGLAVFWTVMLLAFLAAIYIIVAIVLLMIMIAIASWFLSQGGNDGTREKTHPPGRRLREKVIRNSGLFGKDIVRVDEEGRMHEPGLFGRQVGRIDEDGTVRDSSFFPERTGRIDEDGSVYSGGSGWSEKEIGRLDDDGRLTEGSFIDTSRKK